MSKPTTVAAVLTALIPKSEKTVSEKLSTEEFNALGAELTEVHSRLDAQTEGNTQLKADYEAALKRATDAEAQVTTLTTSQTDLQGKLTTAEADRDKYKGFYEEQKESGKELPKEDANSRESGNLSPNDPMAFAANYWKTNHAK
jgi:chromosome segregation ATPase